MSITLMTLTVLLLLVGTVNAAATTVELWRAPGPLCRANVIGTFSTVTFPFYIGAFFFYDWLNNGFDILNFIRALLAAAGILVASSAGTFYMGRAIYTSQSETGNIVDNSPETYSEHN